MPGHGGRYYFSQYKLQSTTSHATSHGHATRHDDDDGAETTARAQDNGGHIMIAQDEHKDAPTHIDIAGEKRQ